MIFNIIYIFSGGNGNNLAKKYSNTESLVLGVPYRHNFYFDGWYKERDFSGSRVHIIPERTNGDIRLWAKWIPFILEGANISFLGDSITTFYNEASPVNSLYSETNQFYYPIYSTTVKQVNQTWWYKVIEQTKTKLIANDSWSGSSCYNNGSITNSGAMNLIRINNLKQSDIVIVFIGTNDNVNGYISQFAPSYTIMIENIKKVCPKAFIFCCLMGYSAYSGYFYTEENRLAFNETIRKIAFSQGCYIIDFSLIQTKDNYSTILGDNLHLSADGMIAYSKKAIAEIKYFLGGM